MANVHKVKQAAADRLYARMKTRDPHALKVAGALVCGAKAGDPKCKAAVSHLRASHARMGAAPKHPVVQAAHNVYRRMAMGDRVAIGAVAAVHQAAMKGHPQAQAAKALLDHTHRELRGTVSLSGRTIEPAVMKKILGVIHKARWSKA